MNSIDWMQQWEEEKELTLIQKKQLASKSELADLLNERDELLRKLQDCITRIIKTEIKVKKLHR